LKLQKDEELGYEFAELELLGIIIEEASIDIPCDSCEETVKGYVVYFNNDSVRAMLARLESCKKLLRNLMSCS